MKKSSNPIRTTVFNNFLELYNKHKNCFTGDNGYQETFFWEYEFLPEEGKELLPPKDLLVPEKVFNFFREEGENITEEKFFHLIFVL